jgi:hypothetical protein
VNRRAAVSLWAVLCAVAAPPAAAGSEPSGSVPSPAAFAASVQQSCVKAGTALPRLQENDVLHPGDYKSQTLYTVAIFRPMPIQCRGLYRRIPEIKFQLQNPFRHGIWFGLGRFQEFMGEAGRVGDVGGKGRAYFAPVLEDRNPKHLYRCTPGPGKTQARAVFRSTVKLAGTGKVVGRHVRALRMKVKRVRGMLKPGRGGVRGAC